MSRKRRLTDMIKRFADTTIDPPVNDLQKFGLSTDATLMEPAGGELQVAERFSSVDEEDRWEVLQRRAEQLEPSQD